MRFFWRLVTFFLIGSSLVTACNQTGSSPAGELGLQFTGTMQAMATEVQQTLEAAAPPNPAQPSHTPVPEETSTPVATSTPTGTATPTPSATLTSTAIPVTPTATTPIAHVKTKTNCRSGPATAFKQLYVALKGV